MSISLWGAALSPSLFSVPASASPGFPRSARGGGTQSRARSTRCKRRKTASGHDECFSRYRIYRFAPRRLAPYVEKMRSGWVEWIVNETGPVGIRLGDRELRGFGRGRTGYRSEERRVGKEC